MRPVQGVMSVLLLLSTPSSGYPAARPASRRTARSLDELPSAPATSFTVEIMSHCSDNQFDSSVLTENEKSRLLNLTFELVAQYTDLAKDRADAIIEKTCKGSLNLTHDRSYLPIPTFAQLQSMNTTTAFEESYRLLVAYVFHVKFLQEQERNENAERSRNDFEMMDLFLKKAMCNTVQAANFLGLRPNIEEATNLGLQQRFRDNPHLSVLSTRLAVGCLMVKDVKSLADTFTTYINHLHRQVSVENSV